MVWEQCRSGTVEAWYVLWRYSGIFVEKLKICPVRAEIRNQDVLNSKHTPASLESVCRVAVIDLEGLRRTLINPVPQKVLIFTSIKIYCRGERNPVAFTQASPSPWSATARSLGLMETFRWDASGFATATLEGQ